MQLTRRQTLVFIRYSDCSQLLCSQRWLHLGSSVSLCCCCCCEHEKPMHSLVSIYYYLGAATDAHGKCNIRPSRPLEFQVFFLHMGSERLPPSSFRRPPSRPSVDKLLRPRTQYTKAEAVDLLGSVRPMQQRMRGLHQLVLVLALTATQLFTQVRSSKRDRFLVSTLSFRCVGWLTHVWLCCNSALSASQPRKRPTISLGRVSTRPG